jgi:DNA-binding PadR family transcriptional regulator
MYELIILGHLMRKPAHGYMIASIINDMLGPYAKLSSGRFYPLLTKLEKDGLIKVFDDPDAERHGERQSRAYQITAAGRERFYRLMLDTQSNPGDYQRIFMIKSTSFDLMGLSERLFVIDHYSNFCQAHILHLKAEAEDFERNAEAYHIAPSWLERNLEATRHLSDTWQLELDWAKALREKTLAEAEGLPETEQSKISK